MEYLIWASVVSKVYVATSLQVVPQEATEKRWNDADDDLFTDGPISSDSDESDSDYIVFIVNKVRNKVYLIQRNISFNLGYVLFMFFHCYFHSCSQVDFVDINKE